MKIEFPCFTAQWMHQLSLRDQTCLANVVIVVAAWHVNLLTLVCELKFLIGPVGYIVYCQSRM